MNACPVHPSDKLPIMVNVQNILRQHTGERTVRLREATRKQPHFLSSCPDQLCSNNLIFCKPVTNLWHINE